MTRGIGPGGVRGAVRVDVSEKVALSDLARVPERSAAGDIRGKVVLIPPAWAAQNYAPNRDT